jgi:hypothetical protein
VPLAPHVTAVSCDCPLVIGSCGQAGVQRGRLLGAVVDHRAAFSSGYMRNPGPQVGKTSILRRMVERRGHERGGLRCYARHKNLPFSHLSINLILDKI